MLWHPTSSAAVALQIAQERERFVFRRKGCSTIPDPLRVGRTWSSGASKGDKDMRDKANRWWILQSLDAALLAYDEALTAAILACDEKLLACDEPTSPMSASEVLIWYQFRVRMNRR